MKKSIRIAAVIMSLSLAAFAFAGCGADTAADSASAPASADTTGTTEENVILPQDAELDLSAAIPDGTYSVTLDTSTLAENEDGTFTIHAEIDTYDVYDIVDINTMKEGDTIRIAQEDVKIETLTKDDSTGSIDVNGGSMEGGYSIIPLGEDSNGYRTIATDDYPIYYAVGETDLTISKDVKVSDSLGLENPSDAPTVVDAGSLIEYMQGTSPESWNCYSTGVVVQDGLVTEIERIWIP